MSKSHFKQFGYCTHRELEQRLCTCSTYKRSLRSLYLWLTLSVPRCLSWMDGQLPETPLLCSRRRSWTVPQKSRRSATLLQSRIKKCLGKNNSHSASAICKHCHVIFPEVWTDGRAGEIGRGLPNFPSLLFFMCACFADRLSDRTNFKRMQSAFRVRQYPSRLVFFSSQHLSTIKE